MTFIFAFEEVMRVVETDEGLMLMGLRRTLKGAARLLLDTTRETNYDALKEARIYEFGNKITPADGERLLRTRKWNRKDESMHYYIVHMLQLANRLGRAKLPEAQLVDVIVDNFDLSLAQESLFNGINTIAELKDRMVRYASKMSIPAVRNTQQSTPKSAASFRPSTADIVKCFNCSKDGNFQSACPYEKLPLNSCFR